MTDENSIDPAAAPQAAPPHPGKECRSEPRFHVHWHADARLDGQVYSGFIKDISLQGADLFLDHNLQQVKSVRLSIHVPPLSAASPPHVVEVSGRVVYSSHDSEEQLFRSGIKFLQFNPESDREYLQTRLVHR